MHPVCRTARRLWPAVGKAVGKADVSCQPFAKPMTAERKMLPPSSDRQHTTNLLSSVLMWMELKHQSSYHVILSILRSIVDD
jgi:hypothetical protein